MIQAAPGQSVLAPAGPIAGELARLSWLLIGGGVVIFGIVLGLGVWAVWRRRGADAEHAPDERPAVRWWIIGGGLVFPSAVLTALMAHVLASGQGVNVPAPLAGPEISVTARAWWWEVRYRDRSQNLQFTTANEIRVPVGRTVTLGLASADVIHSLWVPALAGKVDMVPGRVHQLRLQASRAGVFRGQCAEFCGTQHARMALHVVAMEPDAFNRWMLAQAQDARAPTGTEALRGMAVYRERQCAACHQVRGLVPGPAGGLPAAPDLTHVGGRLHLGAGVAEMSAEALSEWVAHSERAKPGVRMPSYADLDPASLAALGLFLAALQ